jgi:hypothetical protein
MDQNVEKGAMAEERSEHRDSIGDAGKIWMGADGESLGRRGHKLLYLQQQSGGQD